ncbi:mitochondrial carrier domain-containing protein [Syncephalis fuscata]|nr:mitochondrial carrier domain-containing protein [Syncephalis fuscata]
MATRAEQTPSLAKGVPQESAFVELVCGSVGGFVGKTVEFPFDTVKVRLQTQSLVQPSYTGTFDCIRQMIRYEGPLSFYQGLSAPLFGAVLENAALFMGYELAQQAIRHWWQRDIDSNSDPLRRSLSMQERCLAGAMAGVGAAFVLTPVELIKCQLQVASTQAIHQRSGNGPFSVIAHTLKQHGPLGLYRGSLGTLLREVGGGAAWFGVYEWACEWHLGTLRRQRKELMGIEAGAKMPPLTRADLSVPHLMSSGALAGMGYNAALFPADVVKSRMQTDAGQKGFRQVAIALYRAQGIRGFYRGLGITLLRSVPGSSTIFLVYELMHRQLSQCSN